MFALSNITGGTNLEHIHMFMLEHNLVERIIQISNNNAVALKGEATWVLTNAINLCGVEERARFV